MISAENLRTRSARRRLTPRRRPHWMSLTVGRALGYHREVRPTGSWVVRWLSRPQRYTERTIGYADDEVEADESRYLSFDQAYRAALERLRQEDGQVSPSPRRPYTVADAMADYIRYLRTEGKPWARYAESTQRHYVQAHTIGSVALDRLTAQMIRDWRAWIWSQPTPNGRQVLNLTDAELRSVIANIEQQRENAKAANRRERRRNTADNPVRRMTREINRLKRLLDLEDSERAEIIRRRKVTSNRALTTLKAALTLAFRDGKVDSTAAWKRVRALKGVERARVWYLSKDEIPRLAEACSGFFALLVKGAILTGARYGELRRMRVDDFQADSQSVFICRSKSARPRHIYLGEEGIRFFQELTAHRHGDEPMFLNHDSPWRGGEQSEPFREACMRAGITGSGLAEPTFHGLRHTFASHLIMAGASLSDVAALLGHTSTRMVELHYGHLSQRHIRRVAAELTPRFGL